MFIIVITSLSVGNISMYKELCDGNIDIFLRSKFIALCAVIYKFITLYEDDFHKVNYFFKFYSINLHAIGDLPLVLTYKTKL